MDYYFFHLFIQHFILKLYDQPELVYNKIKIELKV